MLRWTTSDQVARRLGEQRCPVDLAADGLFSHLAIVLVILIASASPGCPGLGSPAVGGLAPGSRDSHLDQPASRRSMRRSWTASQIRELRRLARRTWLFFEQFIGPEDQWLPPDHFQEAPLGIVAHRTSPTNIGLALLSALGAYDLGYLEALTLSTRLISSLDTLDKLERYRGHFLNWYDTRSLDPLQPRYVSTVDSGNLAACLLALRQGCLEVPGSARSCAGNSFEGLLDAIDLLDAVFHDLDAPSLRPAIQELRSALSCDRSSHPICERRARTMGGFALRSEQQWERPGFPAELVRARPAHCGAGGKQSPRSWDQKTCAVCDITTGECGSSSIVSSAASICSYPGSPPFQRYYRPLSGMEDLPPSLAEAWHALQVAFPEQPSLSEIPAACRAGRLALRQLKDSLKTHGRCRLGRCAPLGARLWKTRWIPTG